MAQSICSIEDCDEPARVRGWCTMHYGRWRAHGDPSIKHQPGRPRSQGDCSVAGCQKRAKCKDLCPAHYRRQRLGIPMDKPVRIWQSDGVCGVDGCDKPYLANGFCSMHWQRMKTDGEVGSAERKIGLPGSGYVNPSGYRVIRRGGENVLEHREVMETLLGRPLDVGETVHHKNGQRADNRPENLELWVVPQPYGQRAEDLVQWVVDHYPALVREQLQKETQHG